MPCGVPFAPSDSRHNNPLSHRSMTRHIYVDETETQILRDIEGEPTPIDAVGLGVLITEEPVNEAIIDAALDDLRNDDDRHMEDRKAMDETTLRRGHFHASEDSANAHAHLCYAIQDYVDASFSATFYLPELDDQLPPVVDEEVMKRFFTGVALGPIFHDRTPTIVTMEERHRFGKNNREIWQRDTEETLVGSLVDTPQISMTFPKLDVRVADKQEPGLQVADFLLWATQRMAGPKQDAKWIENSPEIGRTKVTRVRGGAIETHKLDVGEEVEIGFARPYPEEAFPLRPVDAANGQELLNHYTLAERYIQHFDEAGLPDHATHLGEEVHRLAGQLRQTEEVDIATVESLCETAIRLFDTIPVYDDPSIEEWRVLLEARQTWAVTLDRHFIHGLQMARWYGQDERSLIRNEDPHVLGL